MAKNNDQALWDDSALISAFNDAVFKYKKVHNMESNFSLQERENECNTEQKLSTHYEDSSEAGRYAETSDLMAIALDVNGMEESSKTLPQGLEPQISEKLEALSNEPYIQPNESQNPEDYEHILKMYYEIEDQRQKVMQQLNQYGNWNNGYSSVPATSQEHQTAVGEAYPNIGCSFCPYGCQSWVAPCNSSHCFNGGSAAKPCKETPLAAHDKVSTSQVDNDLVNTAMFAAERAISSIKEQSSTSPIITNEGDAIKNTSSETDLTVLLNAWYSAGFYTGKYLSEQASAKNKHGG